MKESGTDTKDIGIDAEKNGIDANGKLPEGHPTPDQSTCCVIA